MNKIITIFGTLAIATSPILAVNMNPHKVSNILIFLHEKSLKGLTNSINVKDASDTAFIFEVTLSNSTYNGFSGFINQIDTIMSAYSGRGFPAYFFQWLDDNDFSSSFPNLSKHTQQGFFHDPMKWSNRLETGMGHFGSFVQTKSQTAWSMFSGYGFSAWQTFGQHVEDRWKAEIPSGKVAGIEFDFNFVYNKPRGLYYANDPSFNIFMV